jgi:hypothetical protein
MDVNRYSIDDFRQQSCIHKDDSQVQMDVERSLWNIEIAKYWKDSYLSRRRKALSDIIMSILSRNRGLHYYQGFHDVVSVFLLVFQDDHLAFAVAERVALSFMVDFMQKDFELMCQFMKIFLLIIQASDLELYNHLMTANLEPFFAASWILTWFSHDLKNVDDVARLFDVLLSSPPMYIYYLCAAYVIYLRSELLEMEADFALLHSTLSRAVETYGFPIEELIKSADNLMLQVSLDKIKLLCNQELLQLIDSKKIVSIARPCFMKTKTDSDWALLVNMRLVPEKSNQIAHGAFHSLWSYGWNLTFLTSWRIRTLENQHRARLSRKHHVWTQGISESSAALRRREQPKQQMVLDIVCNVIDEIMFVLIERCRRVCDYCCKENKHALRAKLFWSITFAVGGTIAYSLWDQNFHSKATTIPIQSDCFANFPASSPQ